MRQHAQPHRASAAAPAHPGLSSVPDLLAGALADCRARLAGIAAVMAARAALELAVGFAVVLQLLSVIVAPLTEAEAAVVLEDPAGFLLEALPQLGIDGQVPVAAGLLAVLVLELWSLAAVGTLLARRRPVGGALALESLRQVPHLALFAGPPLLAAGLALAFAQTCLEEGASAWLAAAAALALGAVAAGWTLRFCLAPARLWTAGSEEFKALRESRALTSGAVLAVAGRLLALAGLAAGTTAVLAVLLLPFGGLTLLSGQLVGLLVLPVTAAWILRLHGELA